MSDHAWQPAVQTLPDELPANPFDIFQGWLDEAAREKPTPNPNAMTLATIDHAGRPSARIVLCKQTGPEQGWIVFHSNYHSAKGRALEAHPEAACVFHWDTYERQVRLEGPVRKCSAEESDAYFRTRHWTSRLGAWASEQSQPIASRDDLIAKVDAAAEKLGLDLLALMQIDEGGPDVEIPRPPHWGGYRVWARRVEIWSGGEARIHDRAAWTRELTEQGDGFAPGPWSATRLQP